MQNPWARKLPEPRKIVYKMCKTLGFDSQDHEKIFDFLKNTDVNELIKVQEGLLSSEVIFSALMKFFCIYLTINELYS